MDTNCQTDQVGTMDNGQMSKDGKVIIILGLQELWISDWGSSW